MEVESGRSDEMKTCFICGSGLITLATKLGYICGSCKEAIKLGIPLV